MALRIKDLMDVVEGKAPLHLKEEWDRPGLEVGDPETSLEGVLVGMDVTDGLIDEALEQRANLLLVHHPFLFTPAQTITTETSKGRKILKLIKNNIAVYSVHTNLDKARGGMNETIMDILGFQDFENIESQTEEGIGRIASVEPTTLLELVKHTEKALNAINVRFVGNTDQPVTRVAVINGGGADFIGLAAEAGADCVITGDTKYHEVQDAKEDGIAVIDPGHFLSEWKIFKMFCQEVEKDLYKPGEGQFRYSGTARDPYRYYRA